MGERQHIKASAVREAITKAALPDGLTGALLTLLAQFEEDEDKTKSVIAKFRIAVADWFNSTMDRVGGWYKRRAQALSFGVALGLCIALNLDAVSMVRTLSTNTTVRQSVVAQATRLAEQSADARGKDSPAGTTDAYADLARSVGGIEELGLPVGRLREWARHVERLSSPWEQFLAILTKLGGVLLTALAASLGAPFWFDVLSRFINIRGTGKAISTNKSADGPAATAAAGGPA